MGFFFMVMYIPLIYRTIFRIVSEKQSRVKETMRMMGMGDFAYWASWFTDYTVKNLLISTLCFGIIKFWILTKTEGIMIWTLIFFYGQSIFGLILIAQSLFSNARYAGIVASLIYFGLSLINNSVN